MPKTRRQKRTLDVRKESQINQFNALLKQQPFTLVLVYADWCPHCKVMHEPWSELESERKDVKFFKMESEAIPSDIGISGYPTFVFVKNGEVTATTSGEMSKEDLKSKLFGGSLAFANGGRRRHTRRLRRTRRKVVH